MFEELLGSVREAGAILRGRQKPSRRSVKTLQNWEQDRRRPTGPAAALLSIIAHDPALAIKAIHQI
jgi:putative transcriptional regulator